jgi:hypothetical protein
MRFVRSMTVKRAGKKVEDFAESLAPDAAAASLSNRGHTLCEYLQRGEPTKLYLDYDAMADSPPSPDELLGHKRKVLEAADEILAGVGGEGSYVVASRHGPKGGRHKVSFRVFFLGFSVAYTDIPELVRSYGQEEVWDTVPYKNKDQLLAAVMGRKGRGDGRVLEPEPEYADRDLLDFTAQHLRPGWPHLDIGALARERASKAKPPRRYSRPHDYASWIRIGLVLKRAGCGLAAWDAFSRRSPKYSAARVERAWAGMDVSSRDGPVVGIGTLVAMAREDDPAKARDALDRKKERDSATLLEGTRAAALKLLSEKLPEHFPHSIADAAVAADGRSMTVTAGENVAVVSDYFDVSIAGAFAGNLLTDTELDIGPLTWLHKYVPSAATRFRFDKSSRDTTNLTSVVDGAEAGLRLTEAALGRAVVDVDVPGRASQVVSSQKKINDLAEVVRRAMKVKAREELRPIHDMMFCGTMVGNVNVNNGVQNILVAAEPPADDAGACESFVGWLKAEGYRPVSCRGRLVLYDPEEGIYRDRTDHKGLRRLLRKANVGEYSTSSAKQDALFKQLDDLADEDPEFFARAEASAKRRLAFANGVWDFGRGELLPFSPDIVLFHKLPHRYPENEADLARTRLVAAEIQVRVIDPIWTRSGEYVMQNTARAVAGCVEDRTYHFGIGETASGKGVWMDIITSAITARLVGIINSGNILWQKRTGDQAKNNSWLCACRDNLINFTSEIQVGAGVYIDGNKIKELSSGGERNTGRQNNQDEYDFRLKGMPWSFANDIPPIKPADSAVKARVRFVPMEHTFLVGDEYEGRKDQPGVLRGDEAIKEWVSSPEVGAAFAWMLTQAYVPHKVDVPPHISTETKDWVEDTDQDSLLTTFVGVGGPDDFVTCHDLEIAARAAGMEVSKVKLGKLMKNKFGVKSSPKRIDGSTQKVYEKMAFL